jgi:hypothetical protein
MFPVNSDTNVLEDINFVNSLIDKLPINREKINRVLEITEIEKNNDLPDELFMERFVLLLQLAGNKETRVWGEYDWVSSNAKNPVLFNQAVSIPLNKQEVVKLIDLCTQKLWDKITTNKGRYEKWNKKVPMRFNNEISAHFNPNLGEIKFYNYGDWRFGYFGVFCAETVFHEFAHLLDSSRIARKNILAHDDMFVEYLEMVLNTFRVYIKSKYNSNNHINQILLNSKLSNLWSVEGKTFIAQQESMISESKKRYQEFEKQEAEKLGLKENEYPLKLILNEEQDEVLRYTQDILTKYKEIGRSLPQLNKLRKKIKDNAENTILDKEELSLLFNAYDYVRIFDIVEDLGMMEQSRMKSILENFKASLEGMKRGLIDSSNKDSGRIQQS